MSSTIVGFRSGFYVVLAHGQVLLRRVGNKVISVATYPAYGCMLILLDSSIQLLIRMPGDEKNVPEAVLYQVETRTTITYIDKLGASDQNTKALMRMHRVVLHLSLH